MVKLCQKKFKIVYDLTDEQLKPYDMYIHNT